MIAAYAQIKGVHVALAAISVGGFLARGFMLFHGSELPRRVGVNRASYVIDSLLLAAAVALMAMLGQFPDRTPWLAAKIVGVALYVGLGITTFRCISTGYRRTAWIAFALAIAAAAYVVAVAVSKNPLPFIAGGSP